MKKREKPLDYYLYLHYLWNCECESIESKKTGIKGMS